MGLERKQFFYVYMKEGESLVLGSCVKDSFRNSQGDLQDHDAGCDIVVTDPSGNLRVIDIKEFNEDGSSGSGYIKNLTMEEAGPNLTGDNTSGWTPYVLTANQTGVYKVAFHSKYGATTVPFSTGGITPNPTPKKVNEGWIDGMITVGSFYLCVFEEDENGNLTSEGGRIWTKMLSWNMGANTTSSKKISLKSNVYTLTDDGYVFKNEFLDCDPWGFNLFANSRGCVDLDTGNCAHQTFRSNNNQLSDLTTKDNITIHNPELESTSLDKTFKLFFQQPSIELPDELYTKVAYEPSNVRDLQFIGTNGDNTTLFAQGGFFKFWTENATSAIITMDMTDVSMTDEEGNQHTYDLGIKTIDGSVEDGWNYFPWNGNDADGNPVPRGVYNISTIKVNITTCAGEYHFPLLDVESSPGGIRVTRLNDIYDKEGNNITAQYEPQKTFVYYNNKNVPGYSRQVADGQDMYLENNGADSRNGAMKFGGTYGNQAAIDMWTYIKKEETSMSLSEVTLIITDLTTSTLEGFLFYDEDQNGHYDLTRDDFSLSGYTVKLEYDYLSDENSESEGEGVSGQENPAEPEVKHKVETTKTDIYGKYYFFGIPNSEEVMNAKVTIYGPTGFVVTTTQTSDNIKLPGNQITHGTETQEFELGGTTTSGELVWEKRISMADTGYHYNPEITGFAINKDWQHDTGKLRPSKIDVRIQGGYYDSKGFWNILLESTIEINSSDIVSDCIWEKRVSNLPAAHLDHETRETFPVEYKVLNESFEYKGKKYHYDGQYGPSESDFPYNTAITNEKGDNDAWEGTVVNDLIGDSPHDLKIENNIKGDLGDLDRKYSYNVTFEWLDPDVNYTYTIGDTDHTFHTDLEGKASVTVNLEDDEDVVFHVQDNTDYTIRAKDSNHKIQYNVTEGSNTTRTDSGRTQADHESITTGTERIDGENVTFRFDNIRNLAPLTGVKGNYITVLLVLLSVLVTLGGIIVMLPRQRYK